MLYELSSPLFTVSALLVLGGIVYSAKSFFDRRMTALSGTDTDNGELEQAEA
ncbi:MAG: hypothetical protein R3280_00955 [Marinobacter sp.]|uniref:hypothetical protein n=1 Tax=Marinobacter sp. TaxID=50741 RepID=UPI00299D5998|nr:hypothetical protein [Marinobacter sp.]MDX1633181.1 hypothetical protein [Marinobacter sp.]